MSFVNKKPLKIYELDRNQDIINRIAAMLNTRVKYLYFNDYIPMIDSVKGKNIEVEDILKLIKEDAKKNQDFESFLINVILPRIEMNLINIENKEERETEKDREIKNILKVWIAEVSKNYIGNDNKSKTVMKLYLYEELSKSLVPKYFKSGKELENFMYNSSIYGIINMDSILEELKNNIEDDSKMSKVIEKRYEKYEKIKIEYTATEFEIEKVTFTVILKNLEKITLLEIFNYVILSQFISPFATCQDFYKIHKDFTPPLNWSETDDTGILFKISTIDNAEITKLKDYSNITVRKEEDNFIASINIDSTKKNVSKKDFKDRFLSVFSGELKIEYGKEEEIKVVGIFYYEGLKFNKYVFSDLVMLNETFSHFLSINESQSTTKKKSELFIVYNEDYNANNNITAALTVKTIKKNNDIFSIGKTYVRVKIRGARNRKAVDNFSKVLSKLFTIYNEEESKIIKEYREYIPEFGSVVEEEDEEIDLESDLFIKNYSTQCGFIPTEIKEDEKEGEESKGKKVLKFPKDGNDVKYYVCNYEDHKYPGLHINKLPNKDKYPEVPCCFQKDQSIGKGRHAGLYRQYYEGKELVKKITKQQGINIGEKILSRGKIGKIPDQLTKLFSVVNDDKYEYVLKGVYRTKNSFLNCVMEAMYDRVDISNDIFRMKESVLQKYLQDERISDTFTNQKYTSLCRQELYDMNKKEIEKVLNDENEYLDPQKFISILEHRYECKIFLFRRDDGLILPRHTQAYYTNENRRDCVFIFEHMGSRGEKNTYPQCELIIKRKKPEKETNINIDETIKKIYITKKNNKIDETKQILSKYFRSAYSNTISRNIRLIFNDLRQAYILNKKIPEVIFPININRINSQKIDSYGKTRQITIKFEKYITLFTSPIPPLFIKNKDDIETYIIDIELALKFMDDKKIKSRYQTVINNVVKELGGIWGNVDITIPINNGKIQKGLEMRDTLHFSDINEESELKKFNINKRLARYIVQYVYWIFSKFIYEKNNSDIRGKVIINEEDIIEFNKEKLIVNEDFKYNIDNVNKNFSYKSGLFNEKKQLILDSEETRKRLLFVLRHEIVRDRKGIINFKNNTVIYNYYEDITDFDQKYNQVILYGEESIEKWTYDKQESYILYDEMIIGKKSPYFFQFSQTSKKTDKNIYLAQPVSNIYEGFSVILNWYKNGYNKGIYVSEIDDTISHQFYTYINKENIKKHDIIGRTEPIPIQYVKIIGYKSEMVSYYTVLLSI